jgi:hypothetical protein
MEGTTEQQRRCCARQVCFVAIRAFPPAQCLIKPEPQVTAFIPPPTIQVPFGYGNPTCARWLATQGPSGQLYPPEDIEMFTRKSLLSSFGRTAALATVAALALTALEPSTAQARYYRGGGGAAAAAAFAGIVGTGLAIAASQDRGYYGGPAYYGGGPAYGSPYDSYGYYGGPPAYYGGGPAYYGGGGYGYGGSSKSYFHGHRIPDGG